MTDNKKRPGHADHPLIPARASHLATRRRPGTATKPWHPPRAMGLARALLKAGYGTRRQTENMVKEGKVRLGDQIITDPRHTADAGADIYLNGELLQQLDLRYFVLHKPLRVVWGGEPGPLRKQVEDFFPPAIAGLAAAGRMDGRTTGMILISNDTVWNNMISTTKGLEQEYRIQVEGDLSELEISVMTAGVHLPTLGLFRPESVRIVEVLNKHTVVNMTVREGKIRQVRRMLTTLRHKVTMVRRIRIGDIRLGDLSVGSRRELSNPEIASIREIHAAVKREARKSENSGG